VHDLPFLADSFDVVLSLDVLSHAGVDDALALREVYRVLRTGGQLILNVAAFDFLKGAHDCAVNVNRRYQQRQLRTLLVALASTWKGRVTGTQLSLRRLLFFAGSVECVRGLIGRDPISDHFPRS